MNPIRLTSRIATHWRIKLSMPDKQYSRLEYSMLFFAAEPDGPGRAPLVWRLLEI